MTARAPGYRPDIDGLRTIAVLPVVLFHAGLAGFGGGYVGVDVFFVISGFLITGILLRDIDRDSYSIANFYRRRIRRIFPALVAVVLTCLVLGWLVLTPEEYEKLGLSAVAVAAFVSNFYFWKSADYFDNAQAIRPLLHTWSLAVEEQFYIFFPPLFALLAKKRRTWVVPVLATIAVASLAIAAVLVYRKPSAAFYLPVTRTWELMLGSLLAIAPPTIGGRRTRSLAGMVGLLLILVPVFLFTSHTVFPGVSALPPVLGAALIIWSGAAEHVPTVARLLGTAPMTFIGRISYSLYLWHVPVFAFAVYLTGAEMGLGLAAGMIALSFVLAWASYRWIEMPFRIARAERRWSPVTAGLIGMAVVLAVSGVVATTHGLPSRLGPRGAMLVDAARDKDRVHRECLSVGDTIVEPANACRLGTPGVTPTALLWGDSHAMVTATALEAAAQARHGAFLFAATADCPVGIGFAIDTGTEKALTETPSYRFCARYNAEMLRIALATPSIRDVVLSSRWTNWRIGEPANPAESKVDIRLRDDTGVATSVAGNATIFERGFRKLVDTLVAAGKRVTIVGPLPEPAFNVPQRLFVEQFGMAGSASPIKLADYRRRHQNILAIFARIRRPGVTFVWPTDTLCQRDLCPIESRGRPMFFDHNHLSVDAAKLTAPLYLPIFS
ncbi:MAG: acyltransferase [Sphingomonas sp.]|uniref:acyltransferase family protein n=1 Tax=Sphingomonas sp. TaxID=28214 RepID=UPI001AC4CF23|nr:acyltransferase family protein [Sphingomonas sp.]MBN8807525.1 acyltransferase [Sphingomonas sp.]